MVSAKGARLPGKDCFTILNFVAECQRAKPLELSSFRQTSKERCEIAAHLRVKIVNLDAPNLREFRHNLGDIGWFVALAPVRHRREVRGIRLSQNAIGRGHARGGANRFRPGKRDNSGEGHVKTDVERRSSHPFVAGKAMKDAAQVSAAR